MALPKHSAAFQLPELQCALSHYQSRGCGQRNRKCDDDLFQHAYSPSFACEVSLEQCVRSILSVHPFRLLIFCTVQWASITYPFRAAVRHGINDDATDVSTSEKAFALGQSLVDYCNLKIQSNSDAIIASRVSGLQNAMASGLQTRVTPLVLRIDPGANSIRVLRQSPRIIGDQLAAARKKKLERQPIPSGGSTKPQPSNPPHTSYKDG